jgi:hypothetical protein
MAIGPREAPFVYHAGREPAQKNPFHIAESFLRKALKKKTKKAAM